MNDSALLQISRVSKSGEEDEIQVSLIKGDTHIRVAVDFSTFADVLTSGSMKPCQVRRWSVDKKIPEFKSTGIIIDNEKK